ncbi:outer membrane beta-barrel protein [Rivibacter subsaxonicus]|uniref:outer membrane beta-barrel protein n=1 Tax=Rivibacter subsaxonicus TaxID=457575 RepID=UPI0013EECF1B|nr:outer membrane beta-barrel protein [Rivibacter subsaxonicus]
MASIVLAALQMPGHAQDVGSDRWQFELTPYLWAAGMDGTVRVNNRPEAGLAVEQSFSDIFKILEFALMGEFEARKGRWGLTADGVYFKVNDEGAVSGPLGFVTLGANANLTQQMYSLAGSYRLVEGGTPVDLFGGLRYTSVKWDIDIAASVPVVADRRLVRNNDWIDPFIGVRVQHALDDRWSLVGYADVGGFGVGSDLALQAMAGVRYAFRPDIVGKFGYRYISADYDRHDFQYDMANAGFYLAVGFRW